MGSLEKMRIGGALVRGAMCSAANYRMSFKTNNSVPCVNCTLFSLRQLGSLPEGKKTAFFGTFFLFSFQKNFPQSDMTPLEMNTATVSGLLILNK